VLLVNVLCVMGAAGCETSGDDEEVISIRQALPNKEALQLQGPEAASAQPVVSQAAPAPLDAPYAKFYTFTRGVRDGVNAVTAGVLGTVWFIVHTKPTSVDHGQAVWGPYTDSLEPASWRFRVSRVSGNEYEYVLEGRPKESSSEQDYRTVLSGNGFSNNDPKHGDGQFAVDLDTARSLDPVKHQNDSGVITVVHDLPRSVTEEMAPLPRTIQVTLAPSTSAAHLEIVSIAREDRTGTLIVDGIADVDESKTTALEDVTVASQWDAAGAGRSDVTLSGGDVPTALDPLTLVECWDTHFKQSYYKDSANAEPTVGEIGGCAFADAAAVQP
jgi:hypothetical protein